MIVIDPVKVQQFGGLAVRQLGRLVNAIILQQKLGTEFDWSIRVEMGDSVALLVKCVTEDSDVKSTESKASHGDHGGSGNIPAAGCIQPASGIGSLAAKGVPNSGKGIRGKRTKVKPKPA